MKTQIFAISLGLWLTACQESTSQRATNQASLNSKTSVCGIAKSQQGRPAAQLRTLGYPGTASYYDYVQVRLSNPPAAFQTEFGYVQFFDYRFSVRGLDPLGQKALRLELLSTITNRRVYPERDNEEAYHMTQALLDKYKDAKPMIVVYVSGIQSNVLEIAYYTESGTSVEQSTGLLPPFLVSPEEFKLSKADLGASVVNQIAPLHPLHHLQNRTEQEYMDAISPYCMLDALPGF